MSIYTSVMAQSNGFDTSRMDRSADACDDFFQFANGTWIKNTEIPASQSRWGSFNILAENNRDILKNILEGNAGKKAAKGSDAQLIGDFYASCMDEAKIEKADIKPLKNVFKEIDKMKTAKDVEGEIARLHNSGIGILFDEADNNLAQCNFVGTDDTGLVAVLDPEGGLKALFAAHPDQVRRVAVNSNYIARDMDTWDDYCALHREVFGVAAPELPGKHA